MEGENLPKWIRKICYENHLVCAHFILDSQISLQTVFSKSIAKIFLLLFILKENYCLHRRFLIWWKITKLLMHVHSLTYLLSPRHILTLFDITSFIDSVAEAIEEDSTMDEVTTGTMLVLIEQFMTLLAVTLLMPILT